MHIPARSALGPWAAPAPRRGPSQAWSTMTGRVRRCSSMSRLNACVCQVKLCRQKCFLSGGFRASNAAVPTIHDTHTHTHTLAANKSFSRRFTHTHTHTHTHTYIHTHTTQTLTKLEIDKAHNLKRTKCSLYRSAQSSEWQGLCVFVCVCVCVCVCVVSALSCSLLLSLALSCFHTLLSLALSCFHTLTFRCFELLPRVIHGGGAESSL